jgi:predicted CoA-substrate-specific enzyme activase
MSYDFIPYTALDIGSTTTKFVMLDQNKKLLFSDYVRHNANIYLSINTILKKVLSLYGNRDCYFSITGSAGMGIAETYHLPFIQEVIASGETVKEFYHQVKTMIDIGGEDTKIIYFDNLGRMDMSMNGNCAGGTGAFLDQMAVLLDISLDDLNQLYFRHNKIYPIASRCGVFAKTDVQNLLSNHVPHEDIAASILHALAIQVINSLSRGRKIQPKLLFCGGPLAFLSALRTAFITILSLRESDTVLPPRPELVPAVGAAMAENKLKMNLKVLLDLFSREKGSANFSSNLKPLFQNKDELQLWQQKRSQYNTETVDLKAVNGSEVYLGIDAGSTTSKLVLIDNKKRVVFKFYANNNGDHIKTVKKGLEHLFTKVKNSNIDIKIKNVVVTGYGEELIQKAFGIREGVVETVAHYRAAKHFCKDVSFILDIGGQDIKAIFLKNGVITNIEINEACSSGCGSFIETFARSLNYDITEFASLACNAKSPCDLGTRCTVFMNSKVKQSFREGSSVEEISAGLAYSILKNCFNKVLKIHDPQVLGENIFVQGGTFKNPAILRALEIYLNKNVVCPDICEFMGAFGAALLALEKDQKENNYLYTLKEFRYADKYSKKYMVCSGCTNHCNLTQLKFISGEKFYSGNRCESKFNNNARAEKSGVNFYQLKYDLLFTRTMSPKRKPLLTIGIPRVLNMYENFPFWCTLLVESGFKVILSAPSTNQLLEKGLSTIMSDNICFPAKLVHGHIIDLIEQKVDRIFYPMVNYEQTECKRAVNSYNCPVVIGYPEVIHSSINPLTYNIPFDTPHVVFNNNRLLKKACYAYLQKLGVSRRVFLSAYYYALRARAMYKQELKLRASKIFEQAERQNKTVILLAGRPYHLDPLIHHKIPELITGYGMDVMTEDIIPDANKPDLSTIQVLSQWEYSNRLYAAAKWAAGKENVQFIQLNSFGCGPDALTVDEVKSILHQYGKISTFLRIDDIISTGSVRLRIRSLLESLKYIRCNKEKDKISIRSTTPLFNKKDRAKLIIAPNFSPVYSLFLEAILTKMGYRFKILPLSDRSSVEIGLKYANNDICYPAIICIGDILKALQSGEYDLDNTVVAISETGGPCRASNYVSLVKKAILRAGYHNIPVITLKSSKNTLNKQPGFKIDQTRLNTVSISALLYSDTLLKMYHALMPRGINKNDTDRVLDKYVDLATKSLKKYSFGNMFELLAEARDEFNRIKTGERNPIKIGLVGEIYVKHNPFINRSIISWLLKHGVEIVFPPLLTFFLEELVDLEVNHNLNIQSPSKVKRAIYHIIEKYVDKKIDRVNSILNNFRFPLIPFFKIRELAEKAKNLISIGHQYGEGWMIAAEIAAMVQEGVDNIICLQPFGCIANHIVAKGIARRMNDLYPDLNLLFLDLDAGTSDVNIHNRLHFFVKNAQKFYKKGYRLKERKSPAPARITEQVEYSV